MEVVLSPVSAFSHSPGVWSHLTPHIWCRNTWGGEERRVRWPSEWHKTTLSFGQDSEVSGCTSSRRCPFNRHPVLWGRGSATGPAMPSLAIAMRALIPLSSLPEPHFGTRWCLAGGEWGAALSQRSVSGVWLWHPVGQSPLTGCATSYPSMFCFIP